MTTVLFFGGVLGVDSCASANGRVVSRVHKMLEIDGRHFAVAGNIAHVAEFCRGLTQSEPKVTKLEDADGVAVELLGSSRLRVYAGNGYVDVEPDSFYSTGSGSEAALGAMHAGACLADCMRAAAKVDGYTSGPFDLVRFDMKDNRFIKWSVQ